MKSFNPHLKIVLCLILSGSVGYFSVNLSSAEETQTELYVNTIPEGAKVSLDGKEIGVTPGLFKVEPKKSKIVVKIEGHEPIERDVTINASRITRLELEFKKQVSNTLSSTSNNLIIKSSNGDKLEIQADKIVISDTSSGNRIQLENAIISSTGAIKQNSSNLLKNSDIEDGTDRPDNWDQGAVIEGVNYLWDKNVGYKSKSSLCIEKTANKYFPIAQGSQTVLREGNQPTLNVSAYVKAEKMTKAVIDVVFLDENDNWISHKWVAYIGSKTPGQRPASHDWKKYSGDVTIPANTKKISICLQVYGPGKVWFDDVQASYSGGSKVEAEHTSASQNDSTSENAEKILRTYAEAIWKELPPKLENIDNKDGDKIIIQTTLDITSRYILPQKDMVDRYLLDQLQKSAPMDQSQWDSSKVVELSKLVSTSPEHKDSFWNPNPIYVAYSFRMMAQMQMTEPDLLQKYIALQTCAPVPLLLVNSDIDHPEMISAYPDLLIMMRLERNQQGLYRCSEIRQSSNAEAIKKYRILPADITPAHKVFWEYGNKAWDELLPKIKSMKSEEISDAASRIAESNLLPKLEVLKENAVQTLAKMPKAESIDRSQWKSKMDKDELKTKLESAQLLITKCSFLPIRWNPLQLADWIKMALLASTETPTNIGKRAMISTIAGHSLNQAIDADPESPIILIPFGDEIFIMHFHRNAAGIYDLADFEWLIKAK